MKHVKVEYIESGSFQGGEEDTSIAGIKYGEMCVVIKTKDFKALLEAKKDCGTFQRRLEKALSTIDELNQAAIDVGEI